MLDEFSKALAPWPFLQWVFGILIMVGGIVGIIKGTQKSKEAPAMPATSNSFEDKRAEWEAYRQLENIEKNSFEGVEISKRLVDLMNRQNDLIQKLIDADSEVKLAMNRLAEAIWNRKQL